MRIAICGANGFLGRYLSKAFIQNSHEVIRIGREHFKNENVLKDSLEGANIVINLCGESFFTKWDEPYKHRLYVSRVETTKKLHKAISLCYSKPYAYIASSSAKIYKENFIHDDYSKIYGTNYLSLLIKEHEAECNKIRNLGLRTVILRFGHILAKDSPFFALLKKTYCLKLGLVIGDGEQKVSWIHVNDAVSMIFNAINDLSFEGIYNVTANEAVKMKDFMKLYGKYNRQYVLFRFPESLLKFCLGEGAENLLKGSTIISKRLHEDGYALEYNTLDKAFEEIYKKI